MKVFEIINKMKMAINKAIVYARHSKAGALLSKAYKQLRLAITLLIARMRMRVTITAVKKIHKYYSAKYLDPDFKILRQYIVLLDKTVIRKKFFVHRSGLKFSLRYKVKSISIEERLFWVNFKNFKKIKKEGWLPRNMRIDELSKRAFYVSSLKRNYQEEYKAVENAIKRYTEYLKEQSC